MKAKDGCFDLLAESGLDVELNEEVVVGRERHGEKTEEGVRDG